MCNKIMLSIIVFSFVGGLRAADPNRLNKSEPGKGKGRGRVESVGSSSKKKHTNDSGASLHRNSEPIRTSKDKIRIEAYNQDCVTVKLEEDVKKTSSPLSSSSSSSSSPQRSRFVSRAPESKKLFFISSDMLDDTLILGIDQLRNDVKKIAEDQGLKKSNFYTLMKGMRSEFVQSNPQVIILANFFLFKIVSTQACKNYLNTQPCYIAVPNRDFSNCVQAIRSCFNVITHDAITWPSVSREENNIQYYKELLEKNKDIHVADVAPSYYGAAVATCLLSQIKDRSLNMRERLKEVANSEKLTKRHCLVIVSKLNDMACFVPSLNVDFDAEPLKDQVTQE